MKILSLIVASIILMCITVYHLAFINFTQLSSEISLNRRAVILISQGGGGRNCSHANYGKLQNILSTESKIVITEPDKNIIKLPVNCFKKAKLMRMEFLDKGDLGSISSAVYRCEDNGMIEELTLAIYNNYKAVPQKTHCQFSDLMKSWDIPIGEITRFPE